MQSQESGRDPPKSEVEHCLTAEQLFKNSKDWKGYKEQLKKYDNKLYLAAIAKANEFFKTGGDGRFPCSFITPHRCFALGPAGLAVFKVNRPDLVDVVMTIWSDVLQTAVPLVIRRGVREDG